MTFVVFATPCLSGTLSLEFFHSYLDTSALLTREGIPHACIQVTGDAYLAKARNRLVYKFLTDFPQATDLFFLDDDVGWPADAVLRLLNAKPDIVAGIYPHKQDARTFPAELLADKDTHQFIEQDGLLKASLVPTGFLRIRRAVFEHLAKLSPTYEETLADGVVCTVHDIFRTGLSEGKWWGEDTDFCRRWLRLDGEIWVDPNIAFTHTGRKQWAGTFADAVEGWRQTIKEKAAVPV